MSGNTICRFHITMHNNYSPCFFSLSVENPPVLCSQVAFSFLTYPPRACMHAENISMHPHIFPPSKSKHAQGYMFIQFVYCGRFRKLQNPYVRERARFLPLFNLPFRWRRSHPSIWLLIPHHRRTIHLLRHHRPTIHLLPHHQTTHLHHHHRRTIHLLVHRHRTIHHLLPRQAIRNLRPRHLIPHHLHRHHLLLIRNQVTAGHRRPHILAISFLLPHLQRTGCLHPSHYLRGHQETVEANH